MVGANSSPNKVNILAILLREFKRDKVMNYFQMEINTKVTMWLVSFKEGESIFGKVRTMFTSENSRKGILKEKVFGKELRGRVMKVNSQKA